MLRDYLGRMDGFEGAAGWISTDCAHLRYFKGMLEPFRGQLTHTLRSMNLVRLCARLGISTPGEQTMEDGADHVCGTCA